MEAAGEAGAAGAELDMVRGEVLIRLEMVRVCWVCWNADHQRLSINQSRTKLQVLVGQVEK